MVMVPLTFELAGLASFSSPPSALMAWSMTAFVSPSSARTPPPDARATTVMTPRSRFMKGAPPGEGGSAVARSRVGPTCVRRPAGNLVGRPRTGRAAGGRCGPSGRRARSGMFVELRPLLESVDVGGEVAELVEVSRPGRRGTHLLDERLVNRHPRTPFLKRPPSVRA